MTSKKHSYAYDIYFALTLPLEFLKGTGPYPADLTETQLLNYTEFTDPNLFFAKYCLEWSTVKCNGDTHKICADDINVRWVKGAQTECNIPSNIVGTIPLAPTKDCQTCLQIPSKPYYNISQPPGFDYNANKQEPYFYVYICFNVKANEIVFSLPNFKTIFFRHTCINPDTKDKSCLYSFGNTNRCSEPIGRGLNLETSKQITNISLLPDNEITKPTCDLKHLMNYQYFSGYSNLNIHNLLNICPCDPTNITNALTKPKYKLFFICPEAESIIEKCPGRFSFNKNTVCGENWIAIFFFYQGIAWKDESEKFCKVSKYKSEKSKY